MTQTAADGTAETAPQRLARLRGALDELDDALVTLVADRAALVAEVWVLKDAAGLPLRDPSRERAVWERALAHPRAAELDLARLQQVFEVVVGHDVRRSGADGEASRSRMAPADIPVTRPGAEPLSGARGPA